MGRLSFLTLFLDDDDFLTSTLNVVRVQMRLNTAIDKGGCVLTHQHLLKMASVRRCKKTTQDHYTVTVYHVYTNSVSFV